MSTYSNLKFELITTGEQSGQWGNTTNTNLGTAVEQAIVGMATLTSADFPSNVATLTLGDSNAAQNARALCLNIAAGAVAAAGTLNVPAIEKPYIIINGSSFAVTVKVSGQTGVSVPAGKRTVVYNNGTDVGNQIDYLAGVTLGSALPVASGGTGQTSYTDGQLLIGNSTGNTLTKATLTAGTGVTVTNSAGGITIAATGGTGSVTSVATSGSVNGITLTGGPITSSGTITLGGTLSNVSLPTQVTGTLAVANGGTGVTTSTGTGSTVLSTSPTLTTPILGTPQSGDFSTGTFTWPTFNQNTTGTAGGLSSILAVASGGTGTATPSLVAGSNVTISGTWPNQTINSTASGGGGGTVTSVAALTLGTTGTDLSSSVANGTTTPVITLNVPTASATNRGVLSSTDWSTFNGKGSGTVTSVTGTAPVSVATGTTTPAISLAAGYGDTLNPYGSKTGGYVLAAPNGITGLPSFRALVANDIPTLNQNTTGTAAGLSATLAVASGGTGVTTSTGSGSNVLSISPTLTTPALGTPSSGNLANCTFPTLNQNTTGSSGSCTGNAATATTATNLSGGTVAATTITATGNITAYFTSDIKFKENIRAIPDALAKVNAIGGKLYDWTDEYIANQGGVDNYFVNKADFGVVAQDVLNVFPIAVHKRPDGSLAVDYIKLAALSFAALVELTARVEALESR